MSNETNSAYDSVDEKNPQQHEQQFIIQKIYIKDISFEAPNLPELFNVEYKPQVKMEMNSKSRSLGNDHFEVVMKINLSAEIEEKTAFLTEVEQAGLFLIKGFNDEQLQQLLGAAGPESLYPFVRETIASLIGKTGFPAIQLAPINFMGLYMERLQQEQEKTAGATATSETIQ